MKIAFFHSKAYEEKVFKEINQEYQHEISFLEAGLSQQTVKLTSGCSCVCIFVNDRIDQNLLNMLKEEGVRLIALRCAGFNHVDIKHASEIGIKIVRVPAYSPYAVAEHTVALILGLNRKTHRAFNRVREGNFALQGLLGFDLNGKSVGVIGTGKIGEIFCQIMLGFGCNVFAYDINKNKKLESKGVNYCSLEELFCQADIVSLHCPYTTQTHHIINQQTISMMKKNVMLINTSRGGLVDTKAVIDALKSQKIGYLGLDVYEEEEGMFFEDLSSSMILDDQFARLLTFSNVLITGHQAFFTDTALHNIADTTLNNITQFEKTGQSQNEVNT